MKTLILNIGLLLTFCSITIIAQYRYLEISNYLIVYGLFVRTITPLLIN